MTLAKDLDVGVDQAVDEGIGVVYSHFKLDLKAFFL